jgi:hypothetical protein
MSVESRFPKSQLGVNLPLRQVRPPTATGITSLHPSWDFQSLYEVFMYP